MTRELLKSISTILSPKTIRLLKTDDPTCVHPSQYLLHILLRKISSEMVVPKKGSSTESHMACLFKILYLSGMPFLTEQWRDIVALYLFHTFTAVNKTSKPINTEKLSKYIDNSDMIDLYVEIYSAFQSCALSSTKSTYKKVNILAIERLISPGTLCLIAGRLPRNTGSFIVPEQRFLTDIPRIIRKYGSLFYQDSTGYIFPRTLHPVQTEVEEVFEDID